MLVVLLDVVDVLEEVVELEEVEVEEVSLRLSAMGRCHSAH